MLYLSRTQWGAQPPKGGAFTRLNRRRVTGVVFHHSGVERPPHGVNAVKAYERHHLSKGWDGIAYNWLVDETGTIFEGRGWDARGGATKGWNAKSISICYTGYGYRQPNGSVLKSFQTLVDEAEARFKKPLWVTTHRRKSQTTCPGDWLGDWVEGGMQPTFNPAATDWDGIIRYVQDLKRQVTAKPVRRGARGQTVRVIQGHLNHRGFDAGVVDGIFGRRTKAAVEKFQESQGFLKVNGVVNGDTFGALFLQ
jgi:hypothetical protein|tara:strand:+ start:53 stop:808 length:756 start_codon:yes stop_codon:yes gene_type:complete